MEREIYSVIFLIDKNPPEKLILLKRAADKAFAPNYYTGIGGKVGDSPDWVDESVLEGAYRELGEETVGNLTKDNIQLEEFARCVFEHGVKLHYFWGVYIDEKLPRINTSDGKLVWVKTEELLDSDIIPTTKVICTEWAQRRFETCSPFTISVSESGKAGTVRLVLVLRVEDGLI